MNIAVVFGGESCEHDISIITALTIFKKYRLAGMQVKLMYVSRKGEFYIGEGLEDFKKYKSFNESKFNNVVILDGDNKLYLKKKNKLVELCEIDFIVNCCHGGAGEDGKFSALLEHCKIPSSSANFKALGIAMDKYLTKLMAISLDVPVVDFFQFSYSEWLNSNERVIQQLMQFDFPVVVKPVSQGSSIGVSLATTLDEFNSAVNLAFKFDHAVICERAIINKREFNCCVVKTAEGKLLAKMDEPISKSVIISFKDKYLSEDGNKKPSKVKIWTGKEVSLGIESQSRSKTVSLPTRLRNQIIKQSKLMYENLDLNGVVRFDYIMDTNKDKITLGEINAIPGSLGYYFFEDINLLKVLYDAGKIYWSKRFGLSIVGAPTIF